MIASNSRRVSSDSTVIRLSVVIPCKNEVATIGQVLRDLADQSLQETFEVIVADGLSNDDTRNVLTRFSTLDLPYHLRVVDTLRELFLRG